MAILYVTEQGASIRHVAGWIIVRRENRIIQEWPDYKVEQIIAFGNIQVTPQTMDYCFANGIDVSFLSLTGRYRGRSRLRAAARGADRRGDDCPSGSDAFPGTAERAGTRQSRAAEVEITFAEIIRQSKKAKRESEGEQ